MKFVGAITSAAPTLLRDGAALVGASLIVYGTWLVFEPAGYLIAGLLLLTAALLNGRRAS